MNSPLQNDDIDNSDNCKNGNNRKNGHNCTNSNYENVNDDTYDDNSDSCCTSDVTNNNNNAFDGVDNSGTHTAKHYNDRFAYRAIPIGLKTLLEAYYKDYKEEKHSSNLNKAVVEITLLFHVS